MNFLEHIKIVTAGNSNVGKTSLTTRFVSGEFADDEQPTIGVDFKVKSIIYRGKAYQLGIWDTAGQERFRVVTPQYYRNAKAALIVYDVSNRKSFMRLGYWMQEIEAYSQHHIIKMLVGNKADKKREVTREDGRFFAQKHSMLFVETSAKTRAGVDYAFNELIEKIMEKLSLFYQVSSTKLDDTAKTTNCYQSNFNC